MGLLTSLMISTFLFGTSTCLRLIILRDDFGSYDTLFLSSDVNIHGKPDEGTFKFSGAYRK